MGILRFAARLVSNRTSIVRRNQALAQRLLEIRKRRSHHLHADLLGEPAWDMLLMLYANRGSATPLIPKDLALGSEMPLSTTLRWQKVLEQHGLIECTSHPSGGWVMDIRLTNSGVGLLDGYFESLREFSLVDD